MNTQIEVLKKELIEMGIEKGLNDRQTIERSQKLDKLLNEYQNKINEISR